MTTTRSLLRRAFTMAVVVGIAIVITCCSPTERDLFHVQSAGARLPVVVVGPRDARTMVVFQHGSPDGAAGIEPLPPGLARLTDVALVAVWAQRSTGLAAGVSTRATTRSRSTSPTCMPYATS
jgi:hypothetical protein